MLLLVPGSSVAIGGNQVNFCINGHEAMHDMCILLYADLPHLIHMDQFPSSTWIMSSNLIALKAQSQVHLTKGEFINVSSTHEKTALHGQAISICFTYFQRY